MEKCAHGQDFSGPTELVTLEPNSFSISSQEKISSAQLTPIQVVPALKFLAEMVQINFLLDSTSQPLVYGSAYETSWSNIFQTLVRAHGFEIAPLCNAFAIGRADLVAANGFAVADVVEGRRIKLRDCEKSAGYTGRLHSLAFDNTPIQDALAQISVISNLNFVLAKDVKGTVTGRLQNIPWDETLDLILILFGLDKIQSGNIVRIDTAENLRAERESLKERICTCCGIEDIKPRNKKRG